jgi:hypothetical protein
MSTALSRFVIVAAAVGGLVLAGLPAAEGVPDSHPHALHHTPKVGDHCLIGTWHDNAIKTSTYFEGHKVHMRYGGGDIDHISASGIDHNTWIHAKPLIGSYRGHRLKQVIHGYQRLLFKVTGPHRLRNTEKGWTKSSTNSYHYRGKHHAGVLPKSGVTHERFHCTAKTLTLTTTHGTVLARETRIARKA